MQRQPVHDFLMDILKCDDLDAYNIRLIVPEEFDRPHLGSVNIIKAAMEAIVEINLRQGLENRYTRKLLGEFSLRMGEEIINFDNLVLNLKNTENKVRNSNLWQKWEFSIGQNNIGYVWACYLP